MNILHVTAPAAFGGLERVVSTLASLQQAAGDDVRVAAVVNSDSHPFLERLRSMQVPAVAVFAPGRAYWRERGMMRDICRQFSAQVVHTHGYRPDVLHGATARRLGVASVSTVHGFTGGDWKNRMYERLQLRALRAFGAVVPVSKPLVERLAASGVPRDRLHLVPNAFTQVVPFLKKAAARAELGVPRDRFRIGWIGRLSQEKGPDILIDAMARLDNRLVALSIIGNGPLEPSLKDRARAASVADVISWHGSVGDAARLYQAFDVFVMSSRTEGTPMVLLEAMAAGIPVVVPAVGGIPDMIGPGEGWLVEPGSSDDLAAALREAVANPDEAARRAAAARRRLERDFGAAAWAERYSAVYAAALQRRSA